MINWIVEKIIDSKIKDDCKKGKKEKNRIPLLFINYILKSEIKILLNKLPFQLLHKPEHA
jgi:hypothetical protein